MSAQKLTKPIRRVKSTANIKSANPSTKANPKSSNKASLPSAFTMGATSKESPHTWDLRALFADEKELATYSAKSLKGAQAFQKRYQGKLHTLNAQAFEGALKQYEMLIERIERVLTYTFLIFAQNTKRSELYAQYEIASNEVYENLVFFELEFCALESKIQKAFIKGAKHYSFYLKKLLQEKPHQLSLSAEQALIATSPVGVSAFSRLFDEHLSALKIGKNKQSEEEVLALLHSPKRCVRKKAQKDFSKTLKKSSPLLVYIFNMVRKDLSIKTRLRHYSSKEEFRHISNQISQKSVDAMIATTNTNFDIVHSYYTLKSKLLGHKLKDYDRYAPLQTDNVKMHYNYALELVCQTYEAFSKPFGAIVRKAIQQGWVSSHPAPNKRGGAFSHGSVPGAHPYVLLNWTGNRRDAFTIAHEFGHMIHQELSKKVGSLNHDTPLTTAETASVFGEMLLFDYLKSHLDNKALLSMYAGKLEDIFSTLFRQVVMTNFERSIHAKDGELALQDFDRIWYKENAKMFGKSVELTKNYARWWSYIPHFIHSPFYCYAYSYGQLLTLALFGLYKSGKCKDFEARYSEFLAAGGSKAPSELVAIFGFDIENEQFWQIGMQEVRTMLNEFQTLLGKK